MNPIGKLYRTVDSRLKASRVPTPIRRRIDDSHFGFLLLLPSLILIGLLFFYPLVYSIWLSLTDTQLLLAEASFLGLDNYIRLFQDPEFWNALFNNLIYAGGTTLLSLVVGLGIALLLNQEFKGKGIATTLVIYPYLIPTVVTATAFLWVFHSVFGVANHFLLWLGIIQSEIAWFSDAPMLSVILVSAWRFMPFVVIIVLARIQTIPDALYEAASVEGATMWQRFRYVTLPQLKLVLFIAALLRFIWVFNMFDIIWLLTGGGPIGATQHLPILIYETMFSAYEVGYAAAVAMIMLVILGLALILHFRYADIEEVES